MFGSTRFVDVALIVWMLLPLVPAIVCWCSFRRNRVKTRHLRRQVTVIVVTFYATAIASYSLTRIAWGTSGEAAAYLGFSMLVCMVPVVAGTQVVLAIRQLAEWDSGQICRKCGYDLRVTTDRCPECGEPT